jgi:hypothetical protein
MGTFVFKAETIEAPGAGDIRPNADTSKLQPFGKLKGTDWFAVEEIINGFLNNRPGCLLTNTS